MSAGSFHYISPSLLPSRAANAVHVVMQVDALRQAGATVTLHAQRATQREDDLEPALAAAYGTNLSGVRKVTGWSRSSRAMNLRIACRALIHLARERAPVAVLSRNLYAAFALGVLGRRRIIFETHQLESGWHRWLQARLLASRHVITVVISQRLVECLAEHHGFRPVRPLVLHDAAPAGVVPVPAAHRRERLAALAPAAAGPWRQVCGYFGHLYVGRGIEVIEAMAGMRPDVLFLIFGGNEADVTARRAANRQANLHYMGHVPHPTAQAAMRSVDVLLMPYQESVSIGVAGHDTARWMSPMKMFEDLATGVPVVSSDLPVLREVLQHERNALVVAPRSPEAWVGAIDRLAHEPDLAPRLGAAAHDEYRQHHTWLARAQRLLAAAHELTCEPSSS